MKFEVDMIVRKIASYQAALLTNL